MKAVPVLIGVVFLARAAFAGELMQVPAAIHIASNVSDGKYSIPGIVSLARKNDIKVIVITDRDVLRWEYGLWPLRNIIKRTLEEKSIFTYGIQKYLDDIEKAKVANPDIVLIPGVETAPFYYWTGSIFGQNLKINDWHKHMLIVGLENAEDYAFLPVIGNPKGLRRPAPFPAALFDQYHGDRGIAPYQNLIDYANARGGLTFWPHPESASRSSAGGIGIETDAYEEDLLKASGYTGFAIFYEGYNRVGKPGGIWDKVLNEYCSGKRKLPVWAMAGLSFESQGDLADYLQDVRTMLLVSKLNSQEALMAMKTGKMYVLRGKSSSQFILDDFSVRDQSSNVAKMMGEELATNENPLIEISGHFLNVNGEPLKIRLIRNGSVIKTFEAGSPFHIFYIDSEAQKTTGRAYYRVEITSSSLTVISNPVFVKYS